MLFEIFKYWQGKIVFGAVLFLLVCCVQCYEVNKQINRINEENAERYDIEKMKTAPYACLVFVVILLVVALIVPLSD
jgi:hypothetical protein